MKKMNLDVQTLYHKYKLAPSQKYKLGLVHTQKTSLLFYTNSISFFKQIQNIPFANDNHPCFTNPVKKLWRNPTGKHDFSFGSLVRRMTNMSNWPKPEVVKNQDPEEHLDCTSSSGLGDQVTSAPCAEYMIFLLLSPAPA